MCFVINKWREFIPTKEYLDVVKGLTSIAKLHQFLRQHTWVSEKEDYWKTPDQFIKESGDCEDFSRFAVDVLVRIIGIDKARFVIHSGKNNERWGNKTLCHAICVFPYRGKLAIFDNNQFKSGFNNYVETGYHTFPNGLKYQEVRDWQGKVLEKKYKWFGVF